MLKVGLTGGIGSGKSLIRRIFSELGVPVYDADSAAKRIMIEDQTVKKSLAEVFGNEIIQTDGTINNKYLAEIIFGDKEKLEKINAIVHPAVHKDFENWAEKQDAPYVLEEAAILFESRANRSMDKVITVCASEEIRIERVVKRDQVSREKVIERIKSQMRDEEKVKLSDFVIYNDRDHIILPQVIDIHTHLMNNLTSFD
jgi:dephospho-CoA kinase